MRDLDLFELKLDQVLASKVRKRRSLIGVGNAYVYDALDASLLSGDKELPGVPDRLLKGSVAVCEAYPVRIVKSRNPLQGSGQTREVVKVVALDLDVRRERIWPIRMAGQGTDAPRGVDQASGDGSARKAKGTRNYVEPSISPPHDDDNAIPKCGPCEHVG